MTLYNSYVTLTAYRGIVYADCRDESFIRSESVPQRCRSTFSFLRNERSSLTADNRALRACAVATGNELEEVPLA